VTDQKSKETDVFSMAKETKISQGF